MATAASAAAGACSSIGSREFIEQRAPEVGFNGVVLYRELQGLGFTGGTVQVQRFVRPLSRAARKWSELATVRFETGPGEQAQVDYGQLWVWIGAQLEKVHLFVFTLGYSRRLYARGYHNERLTTLLDGHERAFRWFGGVTLSCLYDNPRNLVLGRREHKVLWHPLFEDFARYYGFTPRACQPLSGAHQGQGRERRQVCQAQRAGGPALHLVGGSQRLARTLERRGRRPAAFTGPPTNGRSIALPANN